MAHNYFEEYDLQLFPLTWTYSWYEVIIYIVLESRLVTIVLVTSFKFLLTLT
jgi:hypothetical protein